MKTVVIICENWSSETRTTKSSHVVIVFTLLAIAIYNEVTPDARIHRESRSDV